MISVTFLSTATAPFGPSELKALLSTTRAKNDANEITGMMLDAGGHFIETLEEGEEAVDATFADMMKDPRHRDVCIALLKRSSGVPFPIGPWASSP
ncbi:MAG: hypothetical protein JWN68_1738 [Nocardioides sp.]|jgi:hypothetical protein|uniref:BLUF domain-containing protein n=1 Tax=Nocardioides sp. TaxID=35761 RepID=UPI00261C0D0E|nr:BLUF domain-containing protein [Nocardioides sp.]MCW2833785.1 hypothetical protein [Nocardioides sp.]